MLITTNLAATLTTPQGDRIATTGAAPGRC